MKRESSGQKKEPLPLRLLAIICPGELYEGIAGDLEEAYETSRRELGERKAKRQLWFSALRFFRPGIILRNSLSGKIMGSSMAGHLLRVAWRNAFRNKLFSAVNIAGLSLGIAAAFLLFVHVRQELNYESHVPNRDLVYRLSTKFWAKVAPSTATAIKESFPEVKLIGRVNQFSNVTLQGGGATVFPSFAYFADPSIISVFEIPFVRGNPATALDDLNSIVITEKIASQLFTRGEDPIGKDVVINGYMNFVVSGVMKDLPQSTHLKMDVLVSIRQSGANDSPSKTWRAVGTYVRFNNLSEAANLDGKLRAFETKFYEGDRTQEEIDRAGDHFELEPIASIHLNSHKEKEAEVNSDMLYIYIFSTFAILIILIASINFVNLFNAQAVRRAKEIGVRKVIGAGRLQLIIQFFGEAFLMVALSGIVGMLLAYSALPWYNALTTIPLDASGLWKTENLIVVAILVGCTGLLSGVYPAMAITRGSGALGKSTNAVDVSMFRKSLVAFQFVISMFLLIATAVVFSQLDFLQSQDLGFSKSEVIAVKLYGKLWLQATRDRESMRNELMKSPHVREMSVTDRIVGERFGFEGMALVDRPDDPGIDARHALVDERFLETMNIQVVEGRNFSGEPDTIPQYLFNETAAQLAHVDNLVGRKAQNTAQNHPPGQIIGIIKDFNYASLRTAVEPLVLEFTRQSIDYMLIRIDPSNKEAALQHIELTLKKLAPGTIVAYSFLDDSLTTLYAKDYTLYRVTRVFSVVTVLIAILGLFALAAHAAEVRTREVSIRKVLGASTGQVMALLSRDFLWIVLASLVVAIPIAFVATHEWLNEFSYRMELHWMLFLIPVLVLGFIAMSAVWIQSLRVATTNPADNLKHE